MAKSAESANKQHNVGDLEKMIRDCAVEAVRIKEARAGLNEEMGDIRKRLREAGVEPKAFDFAVRVREMEQEAKDNYIDQLRLAFSALGIGAQGEMFPDAAAAE